MSVCSLLDVYKENSDGCRSIVLKHLPEAADEKDVRRYLRIVCKSDVTRVCIPAAGCDVAIAVFTDIVFDKRIQWWQERAFIKDYRGCYPTLELLGQPTGIFVAGVPNGVTDELLLLYFESRTSGGIEGTVDNEVEQVTVGTNRYAIVLLATEQAVVSVLSQHSHKLGDTEISVGPFYPTVHRPILEMLKNKETIKETLATLRPEDNIIEHDVMQDTHPIDFDAAFAPVVEPDVKPVDHIFENNSNLHHQMDITKGTGDLAISQVTRSDHGHVHNPEIIFERPRQNVATVRPVVRHDRDSFEVLQADSGEVEKVHKHSSFDFEQDIDLPSYKIELLKMFRFQMKYESERLRISFKEAEERVTFKATSFEEFKAARVQMYECLDKMIVKVKKLSDQKYSFLSRKQCIDCFRSNCETKNTKVVYETDNQRREIRCYAFSTKDAARGLQLLEDEVITVTINVKPEHEMCLRNPAWTSLKASLDREVTTIYIAETEGRIYIESMRDSKATEAKLKVLQYLKDGDNVSKKLATVTLESSKARCFQMRLEDKVRQEITKKNGTLNVVQQSKHPLILKVSVEGEQTSTDEMKRAVQQIWHESVDFNIVSPAAVDTWLIMKGLDGQPGRDFVSKFEHKHNCFLEVSKDGDFSIPRARVKVEDVLDSSDDEPLEASASAGGNKDDSDSESEKGATSRVFKKVDKPDRKRNRRAFSQYQAGMSEEEAIQEAMKLSMQSPIDEKLDTRPVGVDQPSSNSDNEQECFEEEDIYSRIKSPDMQPVEPQDCEEDVWTSPKEVQPQDVWTSPKALQPQDKSYKQELPQQDARIRSLNISNTTVKLIPGAVVKQQADALVNVVSASRSLSEGAVSKSFLEMGGKQFSQLYEDAKSSPSGIVVATPSTGQLKCSTVLHVQLQKSEPCQKIIRKAVADVLEQCKTWGCKTIAFPPLGVGRMFRFPPEKVAEAMLSEISRQLQRKTYRMKQVVFAIYDREVYEIFDAAFETFDPASDSMRKVWESHVPEAAPRRTITEVRQLPPSGVSHRERRPPSGQAQNRQQSTRGRAANVAQHSRGTHSSSSSSSHSHDSYERKRSASGDATRRDNKPRRNSGTDQKKESHSSRYPDSKPVPNFQVKVIAENKDMCIQARNAFGKKLKEKFLHEEKVDKTQKISPEAKQKIANIVSSNDIKSIKGKDSYTLRGQKGNVLKASAEIMKVLLAEKNTLEVKRKRKANTKRETKEFVKVMVHDEPEVPAYWKNHRPGETLKSALISVKQFVTRKRFETVELKKDSQPFAAIVEMVNATFDSKLVGQGQDAIGLDAFGYDKLFILKIERIENLHLYEEFTRRRQKLFLQLLRSGAVKFPRLEQITKCSGVVQTSKHVRPCLTQDMHPEINEYLLFHGTKESNVKVICNDGLDPKLGSGNAMFGSGVYVAECATKADQYADEKNNRSAGQGNPKKMFLIRTVLGNSFLCKDPNPHKFRRPPCTQCHKDDCKNINHARGRFGHFFDSVVGDNKKLFREFVVYGERLCYPEYLITYERR